MNIETWYESSRARAWRTVRSIGPDGARAMLREISETALRFQAERPRDPDTLRLRIDVDVLRSVVEQCDRGVDRDTVNCGCLSEDEWHRLNFFVALDCFSDPGSVITHDQAGIVLASLCARHDPICLIASLAELLREAIPYQKDMRKQMTFSVLAIALEGIAATASVAKEYDDDLDKIAPAIQQLTPYHGAPPEQPGQPEAPSETPRYRSADNEAFRRLMRQAFPEETGEQDDR